MNLSAKIITSAEIPIDATDLHPHTELYGKMTVNTKRDGLYLRTQPTTDSDVITLLPKGSEFFSYGMVDSSLKWVLGQYTDQDGKIVAGFAYLDYLKKEKTT